MAKLTPSPLAVPAGTPPAEPVVDATAAQAPAIAPPWGSTEGAPQTAPAALQPPAAPVEPTAVPPVAAVVQATSENGDGKVEEVLASDAKAEQSAELAQAEAELQEAKAYLARGQESKIEFDRALKKASDEVDRCILAVERLRPKSNLTNTIQAYHASQKKLLQERADKREAIKKSGIDFKELFKIAAPIDAAFARKTGRGGNRPK